MRRWGKIPAAFGRTIRWRFFLTWTTWDSVPPDDERREKPGRIRQLDTVAAETVLSTMKVRELLKLLESDGWYVDRTRGSHRQFRHPTKTGTVTMSGHPGATVHPKTLKSALRQAGLEDQDA